jgi:hypothetical protein
MRAGNKSESGSDAIREQYLGELAPLFEAAREVESLSPVQKKRIRRRIARTLFGTRPFTLRARLLPVLAALGLLVMGGAAFATAQRLGLLPKLGLREIGAPAGDSGAEARRRMARRRGPLRPDSGEVAQPAASEPVVALAEPAAAVLPAVPDPLLAPATEEAASARASAPPAPSAACPAAASTLRKPSAAAAAPAQAARRAVGQVALVAPRPLPAAAARATENPATAPAVAYPAPGSRAALVAESAPGPALAVRGAPVAPPSAPAVPAPAAPSAPPLVLAPSAAPGAPAVAAPAAAPPPLLTDQALFGQALRKLRQENDATSALALLREHTRAYPKSALAGERSALEVEALLALRRGRDALALLDGMALDKLPRSGERFVVRGELRAAARRWREAEADFDRALAQVSGSPAWHERALWGRGVARLRQNERDSGMADITRYHDTYPKGRFAAEAAKFFPKE